MSNIENSKITKRFLEAIASIPELQKDICKNIGATSTNIASMRRGERYATLENCARLCRVYGISEKWILNGMGKMK